MPIALPAELEGGDSDGQGVACPAVRPSGCSPATLKSCWSRAFGGSYDGTRPSPARAHPVIAAESRGAAGPVPLGRVARRPPGP